MMKRLIGGAALAGVLALGGAAAAEPERAGAARRDGAVKKAPAEKTRAQRPPARKPPAGQVPVKSFNFDGDAIDGERNRPDGTTVFGLQGVRHPSLIRVRGDFLREIARAAERID